MNRFEPGTVSPAQSALTEWLRDFAVQSGVENAKALRVVLKVRSSGVIVVRVTDGEWHAAENMAVEKSEGEVLPTVQRCLRALLRGRDGEKARAIVRAALVESAAP